MSGWSGVNDGPSEYFQIEITLLYRSPVKRVYDAG